LDIFRVNTRILIYQRLKQGVMHFFSNATNTKAEGTTVEIEGCIAAGDVQTLIPWDWTSIDSSNASRIDAWANGGANDICPAGFSVPTGAELTAELTVGTTTNVAERLHK
jgi:hypothetical protein